jgi:hypothetical protein
MRLASIRHLLNTSSNAPSGEDNNPTAPTDQTPPTGERGDASAHGFWQRGQTAIFDVQITDTQSCSYWNKDYQKVLAQQEKDKKNQYLRQCLEMRKFVDICMPVKFDIMFRLHHIDTVKHVKEPLTFIGIVSWSSSRSMWMSAVCWSGAAMAKSSTCHARMMRFPLIMPEYRHGL